jgi:hypothetical protein
MNNMKIIDTFCFFNELDILELRLNILDEYVDEFVLVESKKSHQNKDKILFFNENKNRFSKFLHKINHIIIDEFPRNYLNYSSESFSNEAFQRDFIFTALDSCDDTDIIFISDADEIWNPEVILKDRGNYKEDTIYRWRSKICYFYFNLVASPEDWIQPMFTTYGTLKKSIHGGLNITKDLLRGSKIPNHTIEGLSGWHFSYTEDVEYKLKNFLHTEYSNLNSEYINKCISSYTNPFHKNKTYKIEADKLTEFLPKYVVNNIDNYTKYIL